MNIELKERIIWKYKQTSKGFYLSTCEKLQLVMQHKNYEDMIHSIETCIEEILEEVTNSQGLYDYLKHFNWCEEDLLILEKSIENGEDVTVKIHQDIMKLDVVEHTTTTQLTLLGK